MYGQLYYRALEHTKTAALKTAKGYFHSHMTLTEDCKQELQWWVDNIVSSHNVITHGQPSDTSPPTRLRLVGGQFTMTQALGGFGPMRKNHITSTTSNY